MSKIYILLPTHNRINLTRKFISYLNNQSFTNYHLILVDDDSIDGTQNMVRNEISNLTILNGKGNWWWGGSLNQGYKWIKENVNNPEDIILIINDDTKIDSNFLELGYKYLTQSKKTIILAKEYSLQTEIFTFSGTKYNSKNISFSSPKKMNEINCFSSNGLFLKKDDMMNIGGFYPLLLPHYLSDYEYTYRAFRKGYKLLTFDDLKIYVDETTTGYHSLPSGRLKEKTSMYFSRKNPQHPLYWSNFIILTSPFPWKIINLIIFWIKLIKSLHYFIINRLKYIFKNKH